LRHLTSVRSSIIKAKLSLFFYAIFLFPFPSGARSTPEIYFGAVAVVFS